MTSWSNSKRSRNIQPAFSAACSLPHPALARLIQSFWYVRDPFAAPGLERVLPAGHMHIVISLARDYLADCSQFLIIPDGIAMKRCSATAIVTGIRSRYDLIDRSDMAELIGVIFHPGGTAAFLSCNADAFTGAETALEDVWGRCADKLRCRMHEVESIQEKFGLLEGKFCAG